MRKKRKVKREISKPPTRHRLVRDAVEESGRAVNVRAHCACGEWKYDASVPLGGHWQGELNKAFRELHLNKHRGLKRESIETALVGLLERVEQVNNNPDLYCCVSAVVLFGSSLTDKGRPMDVDIAIETADRVPRGTPEEEALRDKAYMRPHPRFGNMSEELNWPTDEVKRFVKGRKRMFSIHDLFELEHLNTPYQVLYGDPAKIAKEVGYEGLH